MTECTSICPTFFALSILFGLIVGSFCGSTSYRVAHEWSLFKPAGSQCPSCGKRLVWWENIPLLSFILQSGKCRKCKAKLSVVYPLAESLLAAWSGYMFWQYGVSVEYGVFMAIGIMMLLIALVDLESFFIPDLFVTIGVVLAAGASFAGIGVPFKDALIGGAVGALAFQGLRLAYLKVRGEEGMGYGDVKLMLFLGLCCGGTGLAYVVLMAALLAMFFTLLAHWGAIHKGTRLPFGPYLCAGCALYMVFSGHILRFFS